MNCLPLFKERLETLGNLASFAVVKNLKTDENGNIISVEDFNIYTSNIEGIEIFSFCLYSYLCNHMMIPRSIFIHDFHPISGMEKEVFENLNFLYCDLMTIKSDEDRNILNAVIGQYEFITDKHLSIEDDLHEYINDGYDSLILIGG